MKKRLKSKKEKITTSVVYEQLQLEAMENKLTASLVAFERKVRRWYSKNFATPLHETFKLPWDEILTHYYEAALEGREHNEVYEAAVEYIPELMKERELENEELDRALEAEQQETIRRKAERDVEFRRKIESKKSKQESGNAREDTQDNRESTEETKQTSDNRGKDSRVSQEVRKKSQSINNKPQPQGMNLDFDGDEPEDDRE